MANLQHIKHPTNKSSAAVKRKHQEPNNGFMINNNNTKKIKPTHSELLVKAADDVEEEDRLTNLPEPMQLHILSFLSIKQAVRTSALSKSWVSLWTLTPTLNIVSRDFATYRLRDVDKIVRKILDKSLKLNKITFHRYVSYSAKIWNTVFGYALSNGVKEVIASINSGNDGAWPDCLRHISSDSLTRLKLMSDTQIRCRFLGQRSAGLFKNLTNLYLRQAIITDPDSFSGFPALDKLTLYHCCYKKDDNLNVRASQLSALTIKCSDYCRLDRCELSTPKLRIFKFRTVCTFPVFITPPPQALPVLDEFVFDHKGSCFGRLKYQKQIFHQVISIFQTFHNAKSLTISESIVELLSMFPMELMIGCSPFRGLKFLKLDRDGSGEIPLEVQDYLLQYSTDAKISVVKIKHG